MAENSKTLEKAVKEVLGNMPKLRGYTLKELRKKIPRLWPTQRWHLERAEDYSSEGPKEIGSTYKKLEPLIKKSKNS